MKRKKKTVSELILIAALLHTGTLLAQNGNITFLNLQDAINIGLSKSTTVLKGNNNVAYAGTQVLAAYGQYLPNLAAASGYNYDHGNNFYASSGPLLINENRSQFNYQLTSSINIFTGYYNYSNWKAARINESASSLTLERAKQQIELDITQSYLQVILDRKIVELDSSNLSTSLKREDQLTMLTQIGRKAMTDLYQQQAQTSSDKLLFINAKSKLRNDKVILFKKLRIEATDNYDIADIIVDDNEDAGRYGNENVLQQEALRERTDLSAVKLITEYADWNIRKYRSGYLPQVSLSAGLYSNGAYFNSLSVNGQSQEIANTQQNIPSQLYKHTYGLVGINAVWNIFDRFYTKSNVAGAKIVAENARIDLQDTTIAIVSDIKLAHNDYVNAVQQMETVSAGLNAAQKAFEAVNAKYKEGVTDFITEANAQLVLLQAAQNKIQASVNMMLQKKIIDFYLGNTAK